MTDPAATLLRTAAELDAYTPAVTAGNAAGAPGPAPSAPP